MQITRYQVITGFPKVYARANPLTNHQIGKKKTPIAYFMELTKTISSNFEMTLRVIHRGIILGTLNNPTIKRELLFSELLLGSLEWLVSSSLLNL
jgi:hypothetical protein